jgi:hypothetical protein
MKTSNIKGNENDAALEGAPGAGVGTSAWADVIKKFNKLSITIISLGYVSFFEASPPFAGASFNKAP